MKNKIFIILLLLTIVGNALVGLSHIVLKSPFMAMIHISAAIVFLYVYLDFRDDNKTP